MLLIAVAYCKLLLWNLLGVGLLTLVWYIARHPADLHAQLYSFINLIGYAAGGLLGLPVSPSSPIDVRTDSFFGKNAPPTFCYALAVPNRTPAIRVAG